MDEAYDEGGPSGLITVDSGPLKLDRASSTEASFEIVPKITLPTTNLADGQIENKADASGGIILCIYDNVRSKWLSVARPTISFGRFRSTQNQFLAFYGGSIYSNNSGIRMPRNATIVSLSAQLDVAGTCDFRIRKNDSVAIANLTLDGVIGLSDTTINVDVDAGDFLQCRLAGVVGSVEDPFIFIELAWRP